MSWDVSIEVPLVPDADWDNCGHWRTMQLAQPHTEGGTYAMFGSYEADLNVTYNYSTMYYEVLGEGGFRGLNGKSAQGIVPRLTKAVEKLGMLQDSDYWAPTAGNAGYALSILLKWCKVAPENARVRVV